MSVICAIQHGSYQTWVPTEYFECDWCKARTELEILYFFLKYIYLAELSLSCGMWDPVPSPGIKPGLPALGAWSLSHWTTREVPEFYLTLIQI